MNISKIQTPISIGALALGLCLPSLAVADTGNEVTAPAVVSPHKFSGYDVVIFDNATIERVNSQSAMTRPVITPEPANDPSNAPLTEPETGMEMPSEPTRPVTPAQPEFPRDISDQYTEIVQGVPIIDSPTTCGKGDLEIRVKAKGVKYGKGLLVADLHNHIAEDFLKWDKVVLRVRVPAKQDFTEFCVPLSQPGDYALGVYHDKNSNRKFDKGFLKIPKERFGMSNNPRFKLQAPTYEESAFTVGPDGADIEIQLFQSGDILRQNK